MHDTAIDAATAATRPYCGHFTSRQIQLSNWPVACTSALRSGTCHQALRRRFDTMNVVEGQCDDSECKRTCFRPTCGLLEDLKCTICMEYYHEPFVASPSGITYCRSCIGRWVAIGKSTCPASGQRLCALSPNLIAKNMLSKLHVEEVENKAMRICQVTAAGGRPPAWFASAACCALSVLAALSMQGMYTAIGGWLLQSPLFPTIIFATLVA